MSDSKHVQLLDKAPLLEQGDGEGKTAAHQQSTWSHATFIIIGEIMGTGCMGLPYAVSRLGWILGMGSCLLFAGFAVYSGYLLAHVRNNFFPTAKGYADVALALGGRKWQLFTQGAMMANWFLLLPYYLMAAANGLVTAFYHSDFCYYEWALIVMGLMLLPLQLRSLHDMHRLALFSDAAVVLLLIMLLTDLLVHHAPHEHGSTTVGIPSGAEFLPTYNGFSSLVFAYQGQSMFLEIMDEMKSPRDFLKSVTLANGVMCLVYFCTAAIAYDARGDMVKPFLPASLGDTALKTVVGIFLTFHIIVSYLLTNQVLAFKLHGFFRPQTVGQRTAAGRLHWTIINVIILSLAWLVANLIPFFADFQNIIGAALGAPIVFGWPAAFFVAAHRQNGQSMKLRDIIGCALFLCVFLPICTGVGLTAAIKALISDWSKFGKPFTCHLTGYS
eukprot:m.4913 g.4913  ORF g.4913 m.4913 type:complete len:443 (-) comp2466_c0_seq1:63-1391(-)